MPDHAYGYPQMIPTLWATTYIFTGWPEQYFAFYIYIGLIVLPILLNAMVLGRMNWWYPLVYGFAFVWFIAEIRAVAAIDTGVGLSRLDRRCLCLLRRSSVRLQRA